VATWVLYVLPAAETCRKRHTRADRATPPGDIMAAQRIETRGETMEDKSYRARLVPELMVRDMAQSRRFWIDLCGFEVVYQREEEGFVFLDRDGAQFMLDEIRGDDGWITAPLQAPLGRGVNFEIKVKSIGPLYERLLAADWPMYRAMQQRWYRNGQIEIGVQQFLVQDPDGYLLRFSEWIGDRPVATVALSVAAAA